jgi:predicted amidophosphoribosyltransferase
MSLFGWLVAGGIFKIWSYGSRGPLETRLKKNCKIFENSENNPEGRYFFDDYIPSKYGVSDDYSKRILKLKKKDQKEIEKFANEFEFLKGLSNLVIIRVPSHEAGKENGMELLTKQIADKYGFLDLSINFNRISNVASRKRAKRGERSMNDDQKKETKESLEITDPQKFKDKDILLIDDVATTWDTIDCCESVIAHDAEPESIYSLVLGRTNPPKKS